MNYVNKKRVAVIGNGKMAKECADILLSDICAEIFDLVCIVIDTSRENISEDLKIYCLKKGVPFMESGDINSDSTIDFLGKSMIDVIFSINNHQIIWKKLLALPRQGIINFHNGPLPRYGGLNACTWAIFNGESRHGVTWHYVSESVDGGDIIAQRFFDIAPDITAIKLVMICIEQGISLFREMITMIANEEIPVIKQDASNRLFYFERMIPEDGVIDFCWKYDRIDRLVRSLNYNPIGSKLGPARAYVNGKMFFVDKIQLVSKEVAHPPGEVVYAGDKLRVQVDDAIIELLELKTEDLTRIPIDLFIREFNIETGSVFLKEKINE